jgi:dipeptidyl-peptidase-4
VTDTSFPRQMARTARFSLGVPRDFAISPKGDRILFLRTRTGADRRTCLWSYDVASGATTLVVDPADTLVAGAEEAELPAEERARRERARESSGAIVRYSTDGSFERAAFDLNGRLFTVVLGTGQLTEVAAEFPAVDPRIDPSGSLVAYVANRTLRVAAAGGDGVDGGGDRALATPEAPEVSYGLAEFVAAEEMDRQQGHWWAPDGQSLLVARVDEAPARIRYIADAAHPEAEPAALRYPAAGTPNADVSLFLVGLDGRRAEVSWDRRAFEYFVTADWSPGGLLIVVQTRDQRRMQVLEVDVTDSVSRGSVTVLAEAEDDVWLDIVPGVPARLEDGSLVWTADVEDTRRLLVAGEPVTPAGLQVRSVVAAEGAAVLFTASPEPTRVEPYCWDRENGVRPVGPRGGVAQVVSRAGTTVIIRASLEGPGRNISVLRDGEAVGAIESMAEKPLLSPAPRFRSYGSAELRTAVLFPAGYEHGSGRLPVLLSPYGGPHAQMVLEASNAFLEAQWFADQGFAVVIADGHGTPGRGRAWDRSIRGDFATLVLQDQVDALQAAAEEWPDLDLRRVGIRGWSFGGYLAALAILRRPDVFHAAVSGAPVTDWRLYDTHYTERYLGHPDEEAGNYDGSSLLADAGDLEGKLLFIHGMADDNVTVAHTLLLSSALLAAGKAHSVLPLSGVTHMTPQEVVAANRLLLELRFLQEALAVGSSTSSAGAG